MITSILALAAFTLPSQPGLADTRIRQSNVRTTICVPGYTATVRPNGYYTNKLKRAQMLKAGIVGPMNDYEEDHIIPLALGGHPTSPRNLWPMPYKGRFGARIKDRLEVKLRDEVCRGRITLREARRQIAGDWRPSYYYWIGPISEAAKAPLPDSGD